MKHTDSKCKSLYGSYGYSYIFCSKKNSSSTTICHLLYIFLPLLSSLVNQERQNLYCPLSFLNTLGRPERQVGSNKAGKTLRFLPYEYSTHGILLTQPAIRALTNHREIIYNLYHWNTSQKSY